MEILLNLRLNTKCFSKVFGFKAGILAEFNVFIGFLDHETKF